MAKKRTAKANTFNRDVLSKVYLNGNNYSKTAGLFYTDLDYTTAIDKRWKNIPALGGNSTIDEQHPYGFGMYGARLLGFATNPIADSSDASFVRLDEVLPGAGGIWFPVYEKKTYSVGDDVSSEDSFSNAISALIPDLKWLGDETVEIDIECVDKTLNANERFSLALKDAGGQTIDLAKNEGADAFKIIVGAFHLSALLNGSQAVSDWIDLDESGADNLSGLRVKSFTVLPKQNLTDEDLSFKQFIGTTYFTTLDNQWSGVKEAVDYSLSSSTLEEVAQTWIAKTNDESFVSFKRDSLLGGLETVASAYRKNTGKEESSFGGDGAMFTMLETTIEPVYSGWYRFFDCTETNSLMLIDGKIVMAGAAEGADGAKRAMMEGLKNAGFGEVDNLSSKFDFISSETRDARYWRYSGDPITRSINCLSGVQFDGSTGEPSDANFSDIRQFLVGTISSEISTVNIPRTTLAHLAGSGPGSSSAANHYKQVNLTEICSSLVNTGFTPTSYSLSFYSDKDSQYHNAVTWFSYNRDAWNDTPPGDRWRYIAGYLTANTPIIVTQDTKTGPNKDIQITSFFLNAENASYGNFDFTFYVQGTATGIKPDPFVFPSIDARTDAIPAVVNMQWNGDEANTKFYAAGPWALLRAGTKYSLKFIQLNSTTNGKNLANCQFNSNVTFIYSKPSGEWESLPDITTYSDIEAESYKETWFKTALRLFHYESAISAEAVAHNLLTSYNYSQLSGMLQSDNPFVQEHHDLSSGDDFVWTGYLTLYPEFPEPEDINHAVTTELRINHRRTPQEKIDNALSTFVFAKKDFSDDSGNYYRFSFNPIQIESRYKFV